jgi:hypothetical protein
MTEQQEFVERLQHGLRSAEGSQIAKDYENALRLVAQVVFTRSSGFILEFIQNAEDAGMGSEPPGRFSIHINKDRVRISHNARPFNESDVRSICGIQSSKRPEKGTLGYLGIGFKSVFKVTNQPQILSGGFQFKFDKDHWRDGTELWRVLPIWMSKPPEPAKDTETIFIIPFRDKSVYSKLAAELAHLGTELYLFLRWLRHIDVVDEVSGKHWVLENLGEEGAVSTLRRGTSKQRFKFFRTVVEVPESIQKDELTREYRARVKKREIAIAFALDDQGNLAPTLAGAMYGGVYSFLPLGEASSGVKFPIQADFLVQPGRDAINYEARWNRWLLSEIAELCKMAISEFKADDRWRYQFLPVFAFAGNSSEAFERLFGPVLLVPIKQYLESEPVVPKAGDGFEIASRLFRLTEDEAAQTSLSQFVPESEVGLALMGDIGLKPVHPNVVDGGLAGINIQQADRKNLLRNANFLNAKAQMSDGPVWFRRLYKWLHSNPVVTESSFRRARYRDILRYHGFPIVLTADRKLALGGKVFIVDLSPSDPIVGDLAKEVSATKPLLHPDILSGAPETEQQEVRGFLTGLAGVQILDASRVCLEAVLPKIAVKSPKPSPEDLVRWTKCCQTLLGDTVPMGTEIWMLTTDGEIRSAKECLFSSAFTPNENWEFKKQYIPGVFFVAPDYITNADPDSLERLRAFFTRSGVKSAPVNGVEVFAMNFAEEELSKVYVVTRVDKHNFGYDLRGDKVPEGETVHVEVKGKTGDDSVELTGNETAAADKYADSFYLAVVAGIPDSPKMYMLQNPAKVGKKEKLTIPPNIWKSFEWKVDSSRGGAPVPGIRANTHVDKEFL